MRLKVSLPSYKEFEVELGPSKSVKDLKNIVCKKLDIEPELTKLLAHHKPLSERSKVSKLKGLHEPIIVDYLWARHLIVWGSQGQRRIRAASVLLAGAGAIGNEVAKNLALLGVRKLFIVDRDNVEMSNVSRMIFFTPADLGTNKAEVLARSIHEQYPFVETLAFRGDLESMPLKFYLDSDVVVCGLDNVVSRIYLTQLCRRYSIPMVDGGITGLNARVHVYIPPDDPCPICMFPPNQYSQIVGLRNPCEPPLEENAVPSFATSISLVSSIISQETIKVILGLKDYRQSGKWPENSGQPLRSILFMDMKNNRFTPMDLKKGERCFVCGKQGTARELVPRLDLPLKKLRESKRSFENAIRSAINVESGTIRILSETSRGSKSLDKPFKLKNRIGPGDYLRVLVESRNEELHESILRLM